MKSFALVPFALDDPTAAALANLAGVPLPTDTIPPQQKKAMVDSAIDWIRKNNPSVDALDEPSIRALANLAGHPIGLGKMTPPAKKKALDSAVAWLRNNKDDKQAKTQDKQRYLAGGYSRVYLLYELGTG